MSRREDVANNFMNLDMVQSITSKHIKSIIRYAVNYGFKQGESFGKYGAYIEKQNEKMTEAIIQPENDRVWQKELDDIMKDCRNATCRSNESKTVRLLGLIVEILLVRKNGG